MTLAELNIDEDAFDIFVTFNALEKIEFLSDAMEFGADIAILKQIEKISETIAPAPKSTPIISSQDFQLGDHRLCVTTLKGEVQLNSNSLKTIRDFVLKLTMDGLILTVKDKNKCSFDIYRYYRSYNVVNNTYPISLS